MHTIRTSLTAIFVAGVLAFAPSSGPAQDSADADISITRAEGVKISDLEDWVIGVFTAGATMPNIWSFNFDTACVHSTTGAYRLEITVANGPGPLRLESAAGDTMAYELYTSSFGRRRNGSQAGINNVFYDTSPVVLTDRWGAPTSDCGGVANIGFAAIVRQGAFDAAPSGIYRDYATIFVTPE